MQPQFEVADVLRKLGNKEGKLGLNTWQLRTSAINDAEPQHLRAY
jgi:hypothetical protein